MQLHDKAFWFIAFFLVGALVASVAGNWQSWWLAPLLLALLLSAAFLLFGKHWHALLAVMIIAGSGYYAFYDARQRDVEIPFGAKTGVQGVVRAVSRGEKKQDLTVALEAPHRGKIRVTTSRYPAWEYGDALELNGIIKEPTGRSVKRLEKDGIFGVMGFPDVQKIGSGRGSPIMAQLLRLKDGIIATFHRVLAPEQAAFLAGLTLGETAEFSKEFREQMNRTGTSHLVALSGYNISIIAENVMGALRWRFMPLPSFLGSAIIVVLFVLMTGAEASVVRAAIMGVIALLAGQVGRTHSFRNAIAIAAFAMALANPKILVWDVGFQLSFAAVMGLVYLRPAIISFFRMSGKPGFLKWRENLLATIAAQLAALPLLLGYFSQFSPVSLLTNILALTAVPFTMFFGFLIAGLGAISLFLAQAAAFLANLFVSYELGVIRFFSAIDFMFTVRRMNFALAAGYYLTLIAFIVHARRREEQRIHALPA